MTIPSANAWQQRRIYHDLKSVITTIPNADKILVLADFNACVVRDHVTWETFGIMILLKTNSNGLNILFLQWIRNRYLLHSFQTEENLQGYLDTFEVQTWLHSWLYYH